MLNQISWSIYFEFVAIVLITYYLIIFSVFYKADISNWLALKFHPITSLENKIVTSGNQSLDNESALINDLSAEVKLTDELAEEDLLPIIDAVRHQIKIILQDAATKNLIKEEVLYSLRLLLKNYLSLNNHFFQENITQYILLESSNLYSIKVTEDDLKMLWTQ